MKTLSLTKSLSDKSHFRADAQFKKKKEQEIFIHSNIIHNTNKVHNNIYKKNDSD